MFVTLIMGKLGGGYHPGKVRATKLTKSLNAFRPSKSWERLGSYGPILSTAKEKNMGHSIRIIWTFASVKGMMGIVVDDLYGQNGQWDLALKNLPIEDESSLRKLAHVRFGRYTLIVPVLRVQTTEMGF